MSLSSHQQERVEYIIRKYNNLKRQVDMLIEYVGSPTVNPLNAKLRLQTATTLFNEYVNKYNEELISLQPINTYIDSFLDLQNSYYDVAATVTSLQAVEPLASSTLNASNITITERQDKPKLLEVKLPTFDGTRSKWLAYKNKFIAVVHSRTDISNTVKHTQLESSLTGSALRKLDDLPPSEENYLIAWQTLLDSYDQRRLVVNEHLDGVIHLEAVPKATAAGLSNLVDSALQHARLLKKLEVTTAEHFIIRHVERCLPPAVQSRWEDRLDPNTLPTLEQLQKFLQKSIVNLDSLERSASRKRAGDKSNQHQSKVAKGDARALVTAVSGSSSSNYACCKCQGDHRLFKCPEFNKLKIPERWNLVKTNNLCRNCLLSHTTPCKSEKRCKKCARDHHTSLHAEKKDKASSGQSQGQTSSSRNGSEVKSSTSQP